jgi:predicted nucleotidyltransferase
VTRNLPADCHLPDLPAPYDVALRAAAVFILDRYDVLGLIASGTIVRGNPAPNSDLDLYVIQRPQWRQRVQRFFHGVPAEIFVNPAVQVPRYFEDERRAGRPITAHMLATGAVLVDRDPVVAQLIAQARSELDRQLDPSAEALEFQRYMAASLFEDACDMVETDPDTARMIMLRALHMMLHCYFLAQNRFIPRDKDLLKTLAQDDPDLAQQVRAWLSAPDITTQQRIGAEVARRILGAERFFEWESAPEDISG